MNEVVAPDTFAGADRDRMMNRLVRVRPYYHDVIKEESGRFKRAGESKRYPWAVSATVKEPFGTDMVVVEFADTEGPWMQRQAYALAELHTRVCGCPACKGEGIHELRGA